MDVHYAARVERNLDKENTKPDYNKVYFGPQWRKMGVQEKSPIHKTLSNLPDDIFCIDSDTSDGVKSPLLLRKHNKPVDSKPVESELEFSLSAVIIEDAEGVVEDEIIEGPDEGYNSSFGSSLPISTSSPYTTDSESDSDNNDEDEDLVRESDSEQSVCSVVSNGTVLHYPSQTSLTSQASLTSLLDRLQCSSSQTSLLTTDQSSSARPAYLHQSSLAVPVCVTMNTQTTPSCSTQNTQTACTKLVSRGCQAEDMVVCEMNKKLLILRDRFNKKLVEEETSRESLGKVKRECSELRMDRFSLLAQTDELQKTCVNTMCERDKYSALVDHKECQLESLRATLKMRDEEIVELRKQLKGASPRHLTDYRELEMLRIDNIRLLHDNRALTSTVDSLNSQLYSLRRISKQGEETDSLVQMNERLAEDNNLLSVNLNALKREHRNVAQEQEETLEELRYVRGNYKRTQGERDSFHKQLMSVKTGAHSPPTSLLHDNEALISQNDSLKETVSILTEQLNAMRDELESVRSSRDIALLDIDTVLDEKHKLQNELSHMETSNSELWSRLAELRQNCSELSESMEQARSSQSILKSENEELRSTNNLLLDNLDKLRTELLSVNTNNHDLSSKVSNLNSSLADASLSMSDLRCTMEFLQVEHECIESEMDKKDRRITTLTNMVLQHKQSKEDLWELCKQKLKDKTKQLNLSRIKLGYALLEIRELNSQGSTSSFISSSKSTSSFSTTKSS